MDADWQLYWAIKQADPDLWWRHTRGAPMGKLWNALGVPKIGEPHMIAAIVPNQFG